MKKKLLMLLFVVLALVCVFVSCGDEEEGAGAQNPTQPNGGGNANCSHTYTVTETVNPTCGAAGKKVSTCSKCGNTKTETLDKLNSHSLEYETTEPTCSKPGMAIGKCSVCGYETDPIENKPALGHNGKTFETVIVTAPTCTDKGEQKLICKDCQEEMWQKGFEKEIPALKHSYERGDNLFDEAAGVTYVAAACGTDGYFARVCNDCSYDEEPITREMYKNLEGKPNSGFNATVYDEMEGWAHEFKEVVETIAPTCTEPQYIVYKCSNCDATDRVSNGVEAGHMYNTKADAVEDVDFVIDPKPTCVLEGKKISICTVCGERTEDENYIETVSKVNHDTSNRSDDYLVTSVPADCDDNGYKIYKCCMGACDVTEIVEKDEEGNLFEAALGHAWERNGAVSCATGGLTPYKCSRCDKKQNVEDEYSDLAAKHIMAEVVSAATCVTNAVYRCSECSTTYGPYEGDDNYKDGFAHGNHTLVYAETVDSTCSTIGYKIYKCNGDAACTVMGKNDDVNALDTPKAEDIIARKSHEFVLADGSVATTPDGRIECTNCSLQYRDATTEVKSDSRDLCLGACEGTCTCGLKVEWFAYVSPKAPIALNATEKVTVNSVKWTETEAKDVPLAIGGGVIVLEGADGTSYTVEIYDAAGGNLLKTFEVSGAKVYIDLYEYAEVGEVSITATADASVRFCQIVE